MKNYKNYFGKNQTVTSPRTGRTIKNAFLSITAISIEQNQMFWHYGVWESGELFNAGKDFSLDFQIHYTLQGENFIKLKADNTRIFNAIDSRFRLLCLPTPSLDAVLERADFQPANEKLFIKFNDDGKFPLCELSGFAYNSIIAENLDVIGFDSKNKPGLIPILHSEAEKLDPVFWENSTLILPD